MKQYFPIDWLSAPPDAGRSDSEEEDYDDRPSYSFGGMRSLRFGSFNAPPVRYSDADSDDADANSNSDSDSDSDDDAMARISASLIQSGL